MYDRFVCQPIRSHFPPLQCAVLRHYNFCWLSLRRDCLLSIHSGNQARRIHSPKSRPSVKANSISSLHFMFGCRPIFRGNVARPIACVRSQAGGNLSLPSVGLTIIGACCAPDGDRRSSRALPGWHKCEPAHQVQGRPTLDRDRITGHHRTLVCATESRVRKVVDA